MNVDEALKDLASRVDGRPSTLRPATQQEYADKRMPLYCPECQSHVQRLPVIDLYMQAHCTNWACAFKERQFVLNSISLKHDSVQCLTDEAMVVIIIEHQIEFP